MVEFAHLDIADITPKPEMDINGNMMAFQLSDGSMLTISSLDGRARLHINDDVHLVNLSETDYQKLKATYEEEC